MYLHTNMIHTSTGPYIYIYIFIYTPPILKKKQSMMHVLLDDIR